MAPRRGEPQSAGEVLAALQQREAMAKVRLRERDARVRAHELEALKHHPGHRIPLEHRQNRALYVVEDDLDHLVPDGWGTHFHEEWALWASRVGVTPAAVGVGVILGWAFLLRPASGRWRQIGAGLQARPEWLAQKLGYARSHIYRALHELDPTMAARNRDTELKSKRPRKRKPHAPRASGGRRVLAQHFRRLRRYRLIARDMGSAFETWVDAQGRQHSFVDLRSVTHLTDVGYRELFRRRRERSRRAWIANGRRRAELASAQDLRHRLVSLGNRLSERLADRPPTKETPSRRVPAEYKPIRPHPAQNFDTGPPVGGGVPFGDGLAMPLGSHRPIWRPPSRTGVGQVGEGADLPLSPQRRSYAHPDAQDATQQRIADQLARLHVCEEWGKLEELLGVAPPREARVASMAELGAVYLELLRARLARLDA